MSIIMMAVLGLSLLLCSIFDIKKRIIPNALIIIMLLSGLIYSFMFHSWLWAVTGMLFPSAVLYLIKKKSNEMGAGDIKLLSATGAWLGGLLNLYVCLLACIVSLGFILVRQLLRKDDVSSVPFAPFVAFAVMSLYVIHWIKL